MEGEKQVHFLDSMHCLTGQLPVLHLYSSDDFGAWSCKADNY